MGVELPGRRQRGRRILRDPCADRSEISSGFDAQGTSPSYGFRVADLETGPSRHRLPPRRSLARWLTLANLVTGASLIGMTATLLWQMRTVAKGRSELATSGLVQVH